MRKSLKIFFSLTMLMLMAYNIVGYFFIFSLSERTNRIEIQKWLRDADDSNLVLLKVLKGDAFIRESNHEIIVDGKLYDVKKEFTQKDATYFYCINDSKEEQLNKQLAENVQSCTGSGTHHSNTTKISGKNILPEFTFSHSILFFSLTKADLLFSFIANLSTTNVDDIIPPPPQA